MSAFINPRKIMVIEDNKLNQEIANTIINHLGHNTIQLLEGKDAIAKIRAEKPDLIILDVLLPDASGIDICKALKADPELKKIAVIIITALSTDEDQKRIVAQSGCEDYIAKPFFPDLFAKTIGKYIPIKTTNLS